MPAFASGFASLLAMAGLAVPAPRIASLNLCTDELLVAVAPAARVISLSHLSHSPAEASFWREARRYPANDGSIAGIARYRPTLILTMGGAGRDSARLAQAVGARLVTLPYPRNVADVAASARQVGRLAGDAAAGERVARTLDALVRTAPRARPALLLSGAGEVTTPGTLNGDWLRLAGYAAPAGTPARVELEHLLLRPPSLLIRSDYRAGQVSANARWQRHPAWARLRATPTLMTDGRRWTCGGPSLVPEIIRLRRARP